MMFQREDPHGDLSGLSLFGRTKVFVVGKPTIEGDPLQKDTTIWAVICHGFLWELGTPPFSSWSF